MKQKLISYLLLFVKRERMEFLEIRVVGIDLLKVLRHVQDFCGTLDHHIVIDL